MKLRLRLAGLAMVAALLAAFVVAPAAAAAPAKAAKHNTMSLTATITNAPVYDATGALVGTFSGVASVTHVAVGGGQLLGSGAVTGTLTSVAGATQSVSDTFTNAVIDPPATCSILDLTLGPLHLNLLGLVIDLNQVHLTITAQQGPGNLLGNLLCAVTNLLNGTGGLSAAIQNLLNQINALLGGL
jgi:hypothetical protein